MTNEKVSNLKKKYDLGERTTRFGENIIRFAGKIPKNTVTILYPSSVNWLGPELQ